MKRQNEARSVDGFFKQFDNVGFLPDHVDCRRVRIASGHDHNRNVSEFGRLQLTQNFETAVPRQHQVQNDHIGTKRGGFSAPFLAVGGGLDSMALFFNEERKEISYPLIVIDDEHELVDLGLHACIESKASPRSQADSSGCYNALVDFPEFRRALESAEKASVGGDDVEAARLLTALAESDLPALDRALAWTQAASAFERLARESDALDALDRAAGLERGLKRFTAAFKKADYLLRLGRKEQSRVLFAALLDLPEATLAERASVASRLKLLRRLPGKQ